jgi:hypothetical protein
VIPEKVVPIFVVDYDEGFAQLEDEVSFTEDTLAVLMLPCPAQRMGGGAGGQAITSCGFCGEMMPSTAGPHSRDGRYPKPVVITGVGDGLVFWRPFRPML